MEKLQVVGIGASVYDTLMMGEGFPDEDTKFICDETFIQGGGPCATALAAMARQGVRAAYHGVLGADAFGRYMAEDLARYGVDVSHVITAEQGISFHAVVLLNRRNGSRTCLCNRGTLPPFRAHQVDEALIAGAQVLHLDGNSMEAAIAGARIARRHGVKVSLDAGACYEGIFELLPLVDILIPSEEFALEAAGCQNADDAARALFARYRPDFIAVTQGARGGLLFDGETLARYAAYPVEAVDSNGAGDVFHGAFIAAYLRGETPLRCAMHASATSALKCTGMGARRSTPTYEQAEAFLAARTAP